jgi:hypothetical protein
MCMSEAAGTKHCYAVHGVTSTIVHAVHAYTLNYGKIRTEGEGAWRVVSQSTMLLLLVVVVVVDGWLAKWGLHSRNRNPILLPDRLGQDERRLLVELSIHHVSLLLVLVHDRLAPLARRKCDAKLP